MRRKPVAIAAGWRRAGFVARAWMACAAAAMLASSVLTAHAQPSEADVVACADAIAAIEAAPGRGAAREAVRALSPCLEASPRRARLAAASLRADLFAGGRARIVEAQVSIETARRIVELTRRQDRTAIAEASFILAASRNWDSMDEIAEMGAAANVALVAMKQRVIALNAADEQWTRIWLLMLASISNSDQRHLWLETGLDGFALPPGRSPVHEARDRLMAVRHALSSEWAAADAAFTGLEFAGMREITQQAARGSGDLLVAVTEILFASDASIAAEAATAAGMVGDYPRSAQLLERAAGGGANAPEVIASLTERGEIVVQISQTMLGAYVLASARGRSGLQQAAVVDTSQGGFSLLVALQGDSFNGRSSGRMGGLIPSYELARAAARDGVDTVVRELIDGAARATHRLTGSAIADALSQIGARANDRVVVILPPALAMAPLGASSADGEPSLIERYEIRYAPTLAAALAADTRAREQREDDRAMALINGGEVDADLLPAAQFEQQHLAAWSGGEFTLVSGFEGRPQELLTQLGGADVWHFVGHGVWDSAAPERSGLQVSYSQLLTVADIRGLSGQARPRLVFLSACETGLIGYNGDVNQYVGIQPALLQMGATGVVGSLWPVNDVATALLSAKFYDAWAEGRSPTAALRAAQLWLRDVRARDAAAYVRQQIADGRVSADSTTAILAHLAAYAPHDRPFIDPFYWAGFRIFGA